MSKFNFDGPLLKVERAHHHINELETLLGRYVADNQARFSPGHQERAFRLGRSVQFVEPPRHTPTVLGDAIHNLRAALDHAYCILIEANGHCLIDKSAFPFGRADWASIKGSIDGHIKAGNGPSEAVRDYIGREAQPFRGGKYNLLDLHLLDITDKHERILPMGRSAFFENLEIRHPLTGQSVWQVENLKMTNCVQVTDSGILVLRGDINNAFDVTFDDGQPLQGRPILATMRELHANVATVLKGLADFL